jgi:hypothetical protein
LHPMRQVEFEHSAAVLKIPSRPIAEPDDRAVEILRSQVVTANGN